MNETQPAERTQKNFERLPALLSRSDFRWWTGLSNKEISAMTESHELLQYHRKGGTKARYYKWQVAALTGFQL